MDWTSLRNQLLYELLYIPRIESGDTTNIEDNITDKFMDEVEDRLDISFDTICHCLYTISEEMSAAKEEEEINDDNNY